MRKLIAFALVCAGASFAQTMVTLAEQRSPQATESRYYRDGSGNLEYECVALGTNDDAVWARTAAASKQPRSTVAHATLTSIAVATNVGTVTTSQAHGLSVGQWVTVAGATEDANLNGVYAIATVPSGTTFTIATTSVDDATYNEATLKVASTAPRTNANVWSVRKYFYTGTAIDREVPARGSNAMDKACDSRTTYF